MPSEVITAIVSAAISGTIGLAGGWWFGRRRWQPEQSQIVLRLLAASADAIKALDWGEDATSALASYAEAAVEADVLLPPLLRVKAEHLDVELKTAHMYLRLGRLRADDPTTGAKLHAAIESAKATRSALRKAAKKHFGIADRV